MTTQFVGKFRPLYRRINLCTMESLCRQILFRQRSVYATCYRENII